MREGGLMVAPPRSDSGLHRRVRETLVNPLSFLTHTPFAGSHTLDQRPDSDCDRRTGVSLSRSDTHGAGTHC